MDCEILALQRRFQETNSPLDEYLLRAAKLRLNYYVEPIVGDTVSSIYEGKEIEGIILRKSKNHIWLKQNNNSLGRFSFSEESLKILQIRLPDFTSDILELEVQQARYYRNIHAERVIRKKHAKQPLAWIESVLYLRVTRDMSYEEATGRQNKR